MSLAELVDERTGIIHHVRRDPADPDMPRGWCSYSAHVSGHPVALPWVVDRQGFGGSLGRPEVARGAAIGEALERYAGNARAVPTRRATRARLLAEGDAVLAPDELLPLYGVAQYAKPGFPFVRPHDELALSWLAARWLDGDRAEAWIPAAAAYLNFARDRDVDEAAITALVYAGIAAGPSLSAAYASALLEVVERDAVTLWWERGLPSARVTGIEPVLTRLADAERATRDVTIHLLPSETGIPVCGAFVEDHARGLVAFGTAARATVAEAAEKALVEAVGLLLLTREVATEGSALWRTVEAGLVPGSTFFPYRADGAYRQDAGLRWERLTDLPALIQLYLDPSMHGAPLDRLRDPSTTTDARAPRLGSPRDGEDRLAFVLRALNGAGHRAIGVELTPADVARGGIAVVRAFVPGMHSNAPAALPQLGGARLLAPREPGGPPLTPDDLHPHPLLLA